MLITLYVGSPSYALAVPIFQRLDRADNIMAAHRILYVGLDLNLLQILNGILTGCRVVRCPGGSNAYLLIESDIKYSLLLFADESLGTTGAELERFARKLSHRERTPIIIFKKSDNFNILVETIIQRLATQK